MIAQVLNKKIQYTVIITRMRNNASANSKIKKREIIKMHTLQKNIFKEVSP